MYNFGIDCDGVLSATQQAALRVGQKIHGYSPANRGVENFHVQNGWNKDEIDGMFYQQYSSPEIIKIVFSDIKPMQYAKYGLLKLKELGFTNHIITARSNEKNYEGVEKDTRTWLDEFGMAYDTISFSEEKVPFVERYNL